MLMLTSIYTVKIHLYIYSKELAAVVPALYRNFTVSTMLEFYSKVLATVVPALYRHFTVFNFKAEQ